MIKKMQRAELVLEIRTASCGIVWVFFLKYAVGIAIKCFHLRFFAALNSSITQFNRVKRNLTLPGQ